MSFATVKTTLPTSEDERDRLLQNVSERDQQLYEYGRSGHRLAASVTVPGSDLVTVIDTLAREGESGDDGR